MMHFLLSLMPELGVLYNSCYFLFQSCCFVNFTKIVYLKNRLWACLCVPVIVPPFSLCQTFCFVLFCSGTTSCCAQVYSSLRVLESLLEDLGDHMKCWEMMNLSISCATGPQLKYFYIRFLQPHFAILFPKTPEKKVVEFVYCFFSLVTGSFFNHINLFHSIKVGFKP